MKYRSCNGIENNFMSIGYTAGQSEYGAHTMMRCGATCCNSIDITDPEKTLSGYFKRCRDVISERINIDINGQTDRVLTKGCVGCPEYRMGDWSENINEEMSEINMALPGPCNANCFYCYFVDKESGFKQTVIPTTSWDAIIRLLEHANDSDRIVSETMISFASGEITIQPFRDRIYEMTKDKRAVYFTNCFIYDEGLASVLASNPQAQINFSIDCGTPETWHKIKGHDNFHQVIGNLEKYMSISQSEWQFVMKYIILPGINDSDGELQGFIDIMKRLGTKLVCLSRDQDGDDAKAAMVSAKKLRLMLQNSIDHEISVYTDGIYNLEELQYIMTD